MAIGTKGDLKNAIRRRLFDRSDLEQDIDDLIVMTEETLNYGSEDVPMLRCRDMVRSAPVVISGGVGTVPDDFLQLKDVYDGTLQPYRFAEVMSGPNMRRRNAYQFPGTLGDFTIEGTSIYAPVIESTITLVYYGKIPPLTTEEDINWLLTDHPSIYLRGCIMQAADIIKNDDELMKNTKIFRSMVVGLNRSDMVGQFATAEQQLGGVVY